MNNMPTKGTNRGSRHRDVTAATTHHIPWASTKTMPTTFMDDDCGNCDATSPQSHHWQAMAPMVSNFFYYFVLLNVSLLLDIYEMTPTTSMDGHLQRQATVSSLL
jgi:hypothetical protein